MTRRLTLGPLQRALLDALLRLGPTTGPDLGREVHADASPTWLALRRLTSAGAVTRSGGSRGAVPWTYAITPYGACELLRRERAGFAPGVKRRRAR